MRNLEEFNDRFKGQAGFVVASGTSLNSQDLTSLRDQVTIGVNSGCVAVPDCVFFLSDDWECAKWSYFHDLLKSKTMALLYDKKLSKWGKKFGDRAIMFSHRLGWHFTKPYLQHDNQLHICQARTSVVTAIHIAHIMGCDPIVMLGMDGRRGPAGVRYYWQVPGTPYVDQPGKPKRPYRLDGRNDDKFLKVNQGTTDTDLQDIMRFWDRSAKELHKAKINLINANEYSILTQFPKMPLPEVLRKWTS